MTARPAGPITEAPQDCQCHTCTLSHIVSDYMRENLMAADEQYRFVAARLTGLYVGVAEAIGTDNAKLMLAELAQEVEQTGDLAVFDAHGEA